VKLNTHKWIEENSMLVQWLALVGNEILILNL